MSWSKCNLAKCQRLSLITRSRLQAYIGVTIIDYGNQALSILQLIGGWK
jgi:hypothetical protein